MASVFTKIVAGEIPSYKIAETKDYLAFLDVFPLVKGHTLVIPKQEIDSLFDIENDRYTGLTLFAKGVAKAIQKTIPCKKVGMAVVGIEVPHAHIHLIPINNASDMNFARPKLQLAKQEMEELAKKIGEVYLKSLT